MSENSFLRPDENENLNAGEMTLLAESIEKLHIESESGSLNDMSTNLNITSDNVSHLANTKTQGIGNAESSKDILRETQNLTGSPHPLKSVENVKNISLSTSLQAENEVFENTKTSKSPYNISAAVGSIQASCTSVILNNSIVQEKNLNNNDELIVDNLAISNVSYSQIHDVSNTSFSDALDTSFAAKETLKLDDPPSVAQNLACESSISENISNDQETDEKFVDSYSSFCDEKLVEESESCIPHAVDKVDIPCQIEQEFSNEEPSKFSLEKCKEQPEIENSTAEFKQEKDNSLNVLDHGCDLAPEISSVALSELQPSIEHVLEESPDSIEDIIGVNQNLDISGTSSVNMSLNTTNILNENISCSSIADLSGNSTVTTDDKINETVSTDSNVCSSTLPDNEENFAFKVPTVPAISSDVKCNEYTSEFSENEVPLKDDFAFKIPNAPVGIDNEEFTDAAKFFADPSSFQFLENIHTNAPSDSNIARSSLYMKFDPLVHSSAMQQLEKTQRCGRDNMLNAIRNPVRQSVGNFLISFDSPIKSNMTDICEDAEISLNVDQGTTISESDSPREAKPLLEIKEKVNEENLLNLSQTDYPVFHSPENIKANSCNKKTPVKSYTEHELQEALKQANIVMQEEFREKQVEVEQKFANFEKERDFEIEKLKNLYEKRLSNASPIRNKSDSCVGTTPAKHTTKSFTEDELNEAVEQANVEMQGKLILKDKEVEQVIVKLKVEKEHEINQLKEQYEAKLSEFVSPEKFDCCVGTTPRKPVKSYTEEQLQEAVRNANSELEERSAQKQKEMEQILTQEKEQKSSEADKLSNLYTAQNIILEELTTIALNLSHKNKELESHIQDLEAKNEKLKQENLTTQEDFQSVETTFADFHKRYEQCKLMLKTFKENEEHLVRELESSRKQYKTLKDNSEEALSKAEVEIANIRKSNDAQVAVFNAQLKKSELKVLGLENDLVRARREKDELEGLCDNLMTKVSQS